jgi:hypothetical protein
MIPEVAAVVAAAEAFASSGVYSSAPEHRALMAAVEAYRMRATRPAGQVTHEETDRTWGEVVTGDEILSSKTNRWYEVRNSVIDATAGTIKINIRGTVKPIIRKLGDPVKVKRGVMGDAVDTLDILWSGITVSDRAATTGAGPMITEQEEE